MNWQNSTCSVGISIGKEWHGKAYGTDAMKTLIDFIFQYIAVQKIKLQVFSFNPAAIRSYEKCGFTKKAFYAKKFSASVHSMTWYYLASYAPNGRGINRIAQERYYDCCSISFCSVLLPHACYFL